MDALARPITVTVTSPRLPGWLALLRRAVHEVVSRRSLIRHLVRVELRRAEAHSLLGTVTWIIDPVVQMLVFVVVIRGVFRVVIQDYPLFLFSAMLPWKWFMATLGDAVLCVAKRGELVKQVQFPKLVLPVASAVSGLIQFFLGLMVLLGLLLVAYRPRATLAILLLPVIAAVQLVLTLALGVVLAACGVFARDTGRLMGYLLRLWFFLSPGLYSVDHLDRFIARQPWAGPLLRLNPFTTLFEAYRDVVYHGRAPAWGPLAILLAVSTLALAVASVIFKRLEPAFPKSL